MNHVPGHDHEAAIEGLSRSISKWFYAYTAFTTVLRLLGYDRLLFGLIEASAPKSFLFARSLGGYLFMAIPIAISAYSLKTGFNGRCRKLVQGFSACALLNYLIAVAAGLPLLMLTWERVTAADVAGYAGAGIVSAFMLAMFIASLRLGKLMRLAGGEAAPSGNAAGYAVLMAALFIASGVIRSGTAQIVSGAGSSISSALFADAVTSDDCTVLPNSATAVAASPDGRYIAIGGVSYVTLWDAKERKLLMSDDSVIVNALRFSKSGKYLAAAGLASTKEGEQIYTGPRSWTKIGSGKFSAAGGREEQVEKTCVAVYDVENLKRLPQVAIPPDDNPRKIMVVRDVAFRPDEKSVVFVYYHEWNTHGMKKEESSALAERENIPSDRRRSPAFAEMDISSGQVRGEKKFEGLFLRKRELWSLKISPDSSMLSYIHEFKDPENHRYTYSARDFSFYNTYTWEENTVIQDPKHEDVFFYSYRADLKKIYFVYRKKKEFKPGQKITAAVLNTREDTVFAEFDLADGTTRDIASAYSEGMPGTGLSQFSVSPDGKRAAVTGMEAYSGKYSFYLLIVSLDSQEKPIVKKMKLIRGLAPEAPEYTLWFDPLSVMLTIPLAEVKIGVNEYASFRPRFFYVNLTKELISNEPD